MRTAQGIEVGRKGGVKGKEMDDLMLWQYCLCYTHANKAY